MEDRKCDNIGSNEEPSMHSIGLQTINRIATLCFIILFALLVLHPPALAMGGGKKKDPIAEDVDRLVKDTKKVVKKKAPIIKKHAVKAGKGIKKGFNDLKKDLKDD